MLKKKKKKARFVRWHGEESFITANSKDFNSEGIKCSFCKREVVEFYEWFEYMPISWLILIFFLTVVGAFMFIVRLVGACEDCWSIHCKERRIKCSYCKREIVGEEYYERIEYFPFWPFFTHIIRVCTGYAEKFHRIWAERARRYAELIEQGYDIEQAVMRS